MATLFESRPSTLKETMVRVLTSDALLVLKNDSDFGYLYPEMDGLEVESFSVVVGQQV